MGLEGGNPAELRMCFVALLCTPSRSARRGLALLNSVLNKLGPARGSNYVPMITTYMSISSTHMALTLADRANRSWSGRILGTSERIRSRPERFISAPTLEHLRLTEHLQDTSYLPT